MTNTTYEGARDLGQWFNHQDCLGPTVCVEGMEKRKAVTSSALIAFWSLFRPFNVEHEIVSWRQLILARPDNQLCISLPIPWPVISTW